MNKPRVRKVFTGIITLLTIPFILSGCSNDVDCDIPNEHVHKYIGSNSRGTVVTYLQSENKNKEVRYEDGSPKYFNYVRQDDYQEMTLEDRAFYEAKGNMFVGKDNWDFLFNVMKAKRDYVTYEGEWTDGDDWFTDWYYNKPAYDFTGRVCVYHYQFCGHRLVYKDGKWVNERSPFVDDIRDIIDEYPYFELDCYRTVYKIYDIKKSQLKDFKIEDVDEFKQPDLSTSELHPNTK